MNAKPDKEVTYRLVTEQDYRVIKEELADIIANDRGAARAGGRGRVAEAAEKALDKVEGLELPALALRALEQVRLDAKQLEKVRREVA